MTVTTPDMHEPVADLEALLEDAGDAVARDLGDELAGNPARFLAAAEAIRDLAARSTAGAIHVAERLVDVADAAAGARIGDEETSARCRAAARRAAARAHAWAGSFDEAIVVADDAATIADRAGLVDESARSRLSMMHPMTERGRLDDAIEVGRRARAIAEDGGRPDLAARADINVGIALRRRDRAAEAVACFDRARPLVLDEPAILASLDNSRGEALVELQRYDDARAAYESALAGFESCGANLQAAISEGNLAELAYRHGRLSTALRRFELARRRLTDDAHGVHRARLLAEEAEARGLVGEHELAIDAFAEAIPLLDRFGLVLEAARARAGLGVALARENRVSDAATALAAAARGFEDLGHLTARGRCDLVRAGLDLKAGHLAAARRLARVAAATLDERPADAAACRLLLAEVAAAEGDHALASAEIEAGLALARRLDLAPLTADLLHAMGRVRRASGDVAGARAALDGAVAQLERVRGALQATRFRAAFVSDRDAVYRDRLAVTLEACRDGVADVADAFAAAEAHRQRALLDEIAAAEGSIPSAVPSRVVIDDLASELDAARGELNLLYSRLGDAVLETAAPGSPSDDADRIRSSITAAERRAGVLTARLAATGAAAGHAAPVRLDAVRSGLGAGDRAIVFAVDGARLVRVDLDRGGARLESQGPAVDAVAAAVRRFRLQIDRGLRHGHSGAADPRLVSRLAGAIDAGRALHDLLLDGVDLTGVRRLLIVPVGPIEQVPPAALHDGRDFLAARMETATAPSASVAHRLGVRPANVARQHLVVGVSDAAAPGVADEARDVAAALERGGRTVTRLSEDAATTAAVAEAMQHASAIHLACHGRFDPRNPAASGLRLADRWLSLGEIAGMRLAADLVTLSGCETGVTGPNGPGEAIGLARAVLAAGARRVVASLWPVDDAITRDVMIELHAGGGDDAGLPGDAVRARHPHPAHWAAFVTMGGFRHATD